MKTRIRRKFDIKKWLTPINRRTIGVVMLSLGLNVLGRYTGQQLSLPIWLDTVGTFLSAAVLGPFAGGLTGFLSGFLFETFDKGAVHYSIVNCLVGFSVGFVFPRSERLSSYRLFSTAMIAAITANIPSTIINFYFYDGYTGNLWGDALVDMIIDRWGVKVVAAFLGQGLVDFPDKILDVILVMAAFGIYEKIFKRSFREITTITMMGLVLLGMLLVPVKNVNATTIDVSSDVISVVYGTDDGLISTEMNAVTQTSDGYIWVGGNTGLYRFDGVTYEKMLTDLHVSNVNCLYADDEGNLWVGTNDAGVVRYNVNTGATKRYNVASGLSSDSVRSIRKGIDGVYVGTVSSLSVIRPSGLVGTLDYIEDLRYEIAIEADEIGRVFCITQAGTLIVLEDEKVVNNFKCLLDNEYYTAVCIGESNDLWVGTSENHVEHFRYFNNHLIKVGTVTIDDVTYVNNLYYSNQVKGIFVCGENGFGLIDDSQVFYELSENDFDSAVRDAHVGEQGNFWFVSRKQGVLKLSSNIFTIPTRRVSEDIGVVNCIWKDGDELYLGTDSGLWIQDMSDTSGNLIEYDFLSYFENIDIKYIMKDSVGNLWVCPSGKFGLMQVTPEGELKTYLTAESEDDAERFNHIIELSDGTMVAAGMRGIYYISNGEITGRFEEHDGLQVPQILCLLETEDKKLLACSDGDGVYVIRDGEIIEHINDRTGLNSMVVQEAIHCGYGYIYVTNNALYYDDRDEIHYLSNFPYSNNYTAYVADDELWVFGSAGIYVANVDDVIADSEDYSYTLLDQSRGLNTTITSEAWNFYDEDEDAFYICCADGVRHINRSDSTQVYSDYNIVVSSFKCGDDSLLPIDGVYQVPAGNEKIEIVPRILNATLTNPLIRYYIEDVDGTETIARQSDLGTLSLTELKPGNYKLYVQVLDEHSREAVQQEIFKIHKEPLMYEKTYFRAYTMSVGFMVIAFMVWMISNYRNLSTIESQYVEIEEAKDTAERANNAKSKFLASMSHEIRTPINAVLGMDEMILRESNDPAILEYANDIYSAGTHLLTLINQILDTSKIESGKMEITPVKYDLGASIHDIFNLLIHRATAADLSLIVEVDKTLPSKLRGDDVRIKQVIVNVLTNAVKYTKEGCIWLRVGGTKEGNILHLHMEVEDTGIGIKEEDLPNLFDVYKRLEVKKNYHVEGTGLGLTISRQFLQLMGSELKVESEYGKGSKFYFDLDQEIIDDTPLGEDFDPTYAKVVAENHSGGSFIAPDAKVLVVDDNRLNRQVVKSLLKASRIQVVESSGGAESVEMCKTEHYDIIFMDHMMPEMDGVEAMHFIKDYEGGPNENTPIYVLTANAVSGAKEAYLEEGFDGFISKPIVFKQLEEAIRENLPEEMMAPMPEGEIAEHLMEQGGQAPDDLPAVDGLDWNFAWLHLPSRSLLQESLSEFYTLIPVQSGKLDKFYYDLKKNGPSKERFENYRILVHAMKGLAATVGIIPLAGPAKLLEFAAKDEKMDVIESMHSIFIWEWNGYREKLKGVFDIGVEENVEKKEGNIKICLKLSQIIIQALYHMDIDTADMSVKKLKEFTFGEEADEFIPAVEAAVADLDEAAAKSALQKMLDALKPKGGAKDE